MISISKNKCLGCGLCGLDCPVKAVTIGDNGYAVINREKCLNCGICIEKCPQGAIKDIKGRLTIAIGTDDKETIKADDHVGMSKFYQIWEYSEGEMNFKETRENIKYEEDEREVHGDPQKAKKVASVLDNVDVIIGKIFGPNIVRLRNKFVAAVVREPSIKKSLEIIKNNINEIIEEKNKSERRGIVLCLYN